MARSTPQERSGVDHRGKSAKGDITAGGRCKTAKQGRRPRPMLATQPRPPLRWPDAEPGPVNVDPAMGRRAFDRVARYVSECDRAQRESTDPDARTARILAATLTRLAAEFEALEEENALLPKDKQAGDRAHVEQHRELVRELNRTLFGVRRDEWIALVTLVEMVEQAAEVDIHPAESAENARTLWADHADGAAENLRSAFAVAFPREGKRLTVAMVRAAIEGAHSAKKGAPQWPAFVPVATAFVGESDPTAIRQEVWRIRDRMRL